MALAFHPVMHTRSRAKLFLPGEKVCAQPVAIWHLVTELVLYYCRLLQMAKSLSIFILR